MVHNVPAPDLARLRELASRAEAERDARHLAACDPAAILAVLEERDALLAQKDAAYTERNRCVAAIARLALANGWRAGLGRHCPDPDPSWDPEWLNVVYVDLPAGQVSWHVHDSDVALFEGLPAYRGAWDGHTTGEKYARLWELHRWRSNAGDQLEVVLERVRAVVDRVWWLASASAEHTLLIERAHKELEALLPPEAP